MSTEPRPSLAVERRGAGDRLVLLHGFTQNRHCWGTFADDLATDHELLVIDAPGHGDSAAVVADLDHSAALSGEIGGRATYIGYSMGGRTALHLALARPGLVDRLVLIGATAGLDTEAGRAERRDADEALADRIEQIGVDAFIDEWLAQPLFATLPEGAAHREERRSNTSAGLARSLRLCGTGTQRSLWSELDTLTMPVLIIAGEQDPKFIAAGRRMVASIGPNATMTLVPASGHSTHLERPAVTASIIRRWLDGAG